jgi:hypothetical protein
MSQLTNALSCPDKSESLGFPLSGMKFDDVTQWVIAYDDKSYKEWGLKNGVKSTIDPKDKRMGSKRMEKEWGQGMGSSLLLTHGR